jgi:S-adenosylhomocysteine hydrolase
MTRAENPSRLTRPQILEQLDKGRLEEIESRATGEPRQKFLADLKDDIEKAHPASKKTELGDKELRALIANELIAIQKASAKGAGVDLTAVEKNFGSFAARLLRSLYTKKERSEGRDTRERSKKTNRTWALAERGPAVHAPAGLKPFRKYYDAHAGALPTKPAGERLPSGFTIAQARWFHRQYWDAPAYTSLEELMKQAKKDPLFEDHKKIELWQLQRLLAEFPESFPWRWPTRNTILASYQLVEAMLEAPAGTSRRQLVLDLKKKNPRMPDPTGFNNMISGPWKKNPELYPFLEGFPKDESGRVILEAQGKIDHFQGDARGRLSLTEGLANRVRELAADPRLRWDWSPDDFVAFVHEQTNSTAFIWATFLNLRKRYPDFPTWPEVRATAMERMAREIRAIKDQNSGITRKQVTELLNSRLPEGETPWTENQLDTVYKNFPEIVGKYIGEKKAKTEDEARELLEALKNRKQGESQYDVAAGLGHDEMRAKHLLRVAYEIDPEAFKLKPGYSLFTKEDDRMLQKGMELLPIGEEPAALYALMKEKFPEYVKRHALTEPKWIARQVRERLGLQEDWVTHQQTRLANLLAECVKKLPDGASFAELMVQARKKHEIAASDDVVQRSTYRWKKELHKYPEIAKLRDVHGRFPWDKLKAKKEAAEIKRWAGEYEGSSSLIWISRGETIAGFDQAQARALQRLYWSLPPEAEIADLVEGAKLDPAFKGTKVEPNDVKKLMRELRDQFPWDMRGRRFALQSHHLVEALEHEPERTPFRQLIARLQEERPGFPDGTTFTRASRTVWEDEPDRFPFIDRIRDEKGEITLAGRVEEDGFRMKGNRLELTEELARAVEKLSKDPRVRYDWSAEDFRAFLEKELGVPMRETNLMGIRRKFDFVPNWTEIRRVARENFVDLISTLQAERKITSATEMMKVLHEEHGYPLYESGRLNTLRAEFGPEKVPIFRDAKKQETLEACEKFLAEVKKAKGKKGLYEIAAELGWSRPETYYRLGVIHDTWPDALPGLNPAIPYSTADRKMLKAAADDTPIGGTIPDVGRILRSEHPEFFEKHPLANDQVLHGVVLRELGIESWRELQYDRLRAAVVDLAKRTPRGASFGELYTVLRDEYAVEFSRPTVQKLLAQWKKESDQYPEIEKVLDTESKYPWEAQLKLTEALADRVAKTMEQNPEKSLQKIVALLSSDHTFAHENPGFALHHIIDLRQRFGRIPYRDDLAEVAKDSRKKLGETKKLAERMQRAADEIEDKNGLSPLFFARKLSVPIGDVLDAIDRHPKLFPWARHVPGGKIDLTLAIHVGHALEQAPLGAKMEEVVKQLRKDPDFRQIYPAFDMRTVDILRQEYSNVIPDWGERQRVLAFRELANAVLTAKKGTKFETILKELEEKYPNSYVRPKGTGARSYHTAMLERAATKYPFLSALTVKGKLELDGHGKPALPEAPSEIERLAREMPLIPESLPLLDELVKSAPKTALEDFEGLFVQHLLGTTVSLLDAAKAVGLKASRSTIIGTAYASNSTVTSVLRDKGWDARPSSLDLTAWKEEVRTAMYERVQSALENGRRILAVDDGGMVTQLLREDPYLADHASLFSVVEQTRRGITVADQDEILTPLINVAQSLTKAFVEGPMIGDVLTEKLTLRLERLGVKSVKGLKVGVVGKGAIGSPLAEELRKMGAIVTCRDTDESKLTAAEKKISKKAFFGGQDLILGATGQPSIGPDELAMIKDGTIVGSCSSKLVEIDVATLQKGAKKKGGKREVVDEDSFPPSTRYTLPDGRSITLLAEGYPLNFDGSVHSVDPDKIQLTRALLFLGLLQSAKAKVPDVRRLQIDGQVKVLEHFATLPVAKSDPELEKAIKDTLAKLKDAKKDAQAHRTRAPKIVPA